MSQSPDFEELVDQYYVALYRFALSLTRREPDACDLTQQTFLIWAQKGRQLQDPAKAKAWMFTTMYRQFLQSKRQKDRFHLTPTLGDEAHEALPAGQARSVDAAMLLDHLQQLDPNFRAPLALFYLESYTYLEIAEVLEIPIGTVKSRISRAIGQLQSAMRDPQESPKSPSTK